MKIKETVYLTLYWAKQSIILSYYLLACYGLVVVVLWMLDDDPVIHLPPGSVNQTKIYPGDKLIFKQPIQKFRECPGEVQRSIFGECGLLHLQDASTSLEVGEHNLYIPVEIPLSFQPGYCEFHSKFRYFCDPLDYIFPRKVYTTFPIQFTVEERK